MLSIWSLDLIVPPSPKVILGCLDSGGGTSPGYGGTGSSLAAIPGAWRVFMLAWGWRWDKGWPCMVLCIDDSCGVDGLRGFPYWELAES